MAEIARVFGMNVIAWSPNLTAEAAEAVGVRRVDKADLFRQADVISIHLVLGPRSRGLVGAAELALMKQTAFVVNTSRGPIIDEAALIDTLRNPASPVPRSMSTTSNPCPPTTCCAASTTSPSRRIWATAPRTISASSTKTPPKP